MNAKKVILLLLIPILAWAIWLWLLRRNYAQSERDQRSVASKPALTNAVLGMPDSMMEEVAARIRQNPTPLQNVRTLEDLRQRLLSMPRHESVALIRAAWESGLDVSTGLDLKPGGEGRLVTAPSLRVFLLEQLFELEPELARQFARRILTTFTNPDEWAISLAICASDTKDGTQAFIRDKVREMVMHEPWQQQPTAGFLEAFDVFVFTRDTGFVPELAAFLGQTNKPALAHAAFLVLDRLVQSDTATTLQALAARPELLRGREATRAGYFARVDVRDPGQRAVLERYLLNATLGASELGHFAGTFPGANFMVSKNLLTTSTTPDGAAIAARDLATLAVVDQWLADPRFAHRWPALGNIKTRLQQFVPRPN